MYRYFNNLAYNNYYYSYVITAACTEEERIGADRGYYSLPCIFY